MVMDSVLADQNVLPNIWGERNRNFTPVDIANGLIRVVPTVVGRACGPLVGQPVGDIA